VDDGIRTADATSTPHTKTADSNSTAPTVISNISTNSVRDLKKAFDHFAGSSDVSLLDHVVRNKVRELSLLNHVTRSKVRNLGLIDHVTRNKVRDVILLDHVTRSTV